ncbi:hypothetical protein F511_28807 [Dorcoceras hygrometricum]|uniref:Uncharacterized protein n=1 Tax=Dorcoceras hygrometricum TaxID=472368 RepID=A0A2Z7AVB4_9LAMI|nr:hypothetical protein F511_28807 [Dorcoceras hygrometricum]
MLAGTLDSWEYIDRRNLFMAGRTTIVAMEHGNDGFGKGFPTVPILNKTGQPSSNDRKSKSTAPTEQLGANRSDLTSCTGNNRPHCLDHEPTSSRTNTEQYALPIPARTSTAQLTQLSLDLKADTRLDTARDASTNKLRTPIAHVRQITLTAQHLCTQILSIYPFVEEKMLLEVKVMDPEDDTSSMNRLQNHLRGQLDEIQKLKWKCIELECESLRNSGNKKLVSGKERLEEFTDDVWKRNDGDTASRGPATIAAPKSRFRTCPTDMVKRLAISRHDPLGIVDSACKNQLVVVSVQYGPFNTYIPIRSTTIGKSRVARDPIAMHTSWRSNSDIASVTSSSRWPEQVRRGSGGAWPTAAAREKWRGREGGEVEWGGRV